MKEYAKEFYTSKAWRDTRAVVVARANGLCERCKANGDYTPGVIVHHKTYITTKNINDPRVTLNLDNLELVCEDCHNKEHKRKENNRYSFDVNGNLLPPNRSTPPGILKFGSVERTEGVTSKKLCKSHAHVGGVKNG